MATIIDLGRAVKAAHPGAYDDLPDAVVGRKVKLKFPDSYQDYADPQRKRQEIEAGRAQAEAESQQAQADAARGLLNTLPQVGSTIGSLLGPLGSGAGAGLGEAGVQIGKAGAGEGFDAGQIAKTAAGATTGAYAGLGAGKLIGKAGGVITGSLRRAAVDKAAQEYAKATEAGVSAPTLALTQGIPKLLQRAGRAGQAEVDHVLGQVRNFLANKPENLTPSDLHEIRQVMDDIAKPFYSKAGKFLRPPEPATAAAARVAKTIADNARGLLRETVPSATKFEAQASRAIQARKLIPVASEAVPTSYGAALNRTGIGAGLGLMAGGPPGAAVGGLLNAALTAPQIQQAVGSVLESPILAQLLAQLGRGTGTELAR